MATKKKAAADPKAEEKAAKRKARMEALKNRPAEQRPNGKQIDVIKFGNSEIRNFGYPIKNKEGHQGVLVTSAFVDADGNVTPNGVTFVPGNLTVKAKKGHGIITSPKSKKDKDEEEGDSED